MKIAINLLIILIMPLLIQGFIGKFKAFWAGKIGPSVFQPFYDFHKLLYKNQVISTTTGFVFQLAPVFSLGAILFAALLVPLFDNYSILNLTANFVIFSYILAFGRFFMVIGALDTGSSFEGMGANRETIFAAFVEPAFFIIISSFLLLNNQSCNFSEIIEAVRLDHPVSVVIQILTIIILFIMILTEACRIPVDDPKTHLELTMIHEVMILDNSGVDLAYFLYGTGLKIVLFSSLIINTVLPAGLPLYLSLLIFILLLIVIAFIISTVESLMARFRMTHVPQFLFLMISLGLIILSMLFLYLSGGFND